MTMLQLYLASQKKRHWANYQKQPRIRTILLKFDKGIISLQSFNFAHARYCSCDAKGTDHWINKYDKETELKAVIIPDYTVKLVNKGRLFPDGKTVVRSIYTVAIELQKLFVQPTKKLMYDNFLKRDKTRYSKNGFEKTVIYENKN